MWRFEQYIFTVDRQDDVTLRNKFGNHFYYWKNLQMHVTDVLEKMFRPTLISCMWIGYKVLVLSALNQRFLTRTIQK